MKLLFKVFHFLYALYAFLVFFGLMLLAAIGVLISSLFPEPTGGNAIYIIARYWAQIWFTLIGIHHKEIYTTPHDRNESLVFIVNHQSYIDIPAIVRGLHQPFRILAKSEMAKIPIFGYIYKKGAIMVDRSDLNARLESMKQMALTIRKYHLSVLIYPEGTFNETGAPLKSFYKGAFKLAIETQTNIKPIILPDSIKRMHYSSPLSITPGKSRVIYLDKINVQGKTMKDIDSLMEEAYTMMENALLQYGHFPQKNIATNLSREMEKV